MDLSPEEQTTLTTYQRIAKIWTQRNRKHPDYWQKQFTNFQNLLPTGQILDVGCGPGRDAEFFLGAGYKYVGIDISSELLAEATQHFPQATFQEMSMYELDFPDHSFDGFWAAASLLHIPKDRLSKVLEGIARVVKSGGIGFIAVKAGEGESFVTDAETRTERFFAFYGDDEFRKYLATDYEILDYARLVHPKDQKDWLLYWVRRR